MNKIHRIEILDLIKGIAVVLMIQVHIIELFAINDIFDSTIGKISLFLGAAPVAPAFMIVFGYLIAKSKKTFYQLIIRGLLIFLLGLILNILLNLNLIISVQMGRFSIDVMPYIFGVDILHLAGLSIIIIAVLKKLFKKNPVLWIASTIVISFLGHYLKTNSQSFGLNEYVFSYFYGASWWSYFPIFPWLAYPFTGIFIRFIQEEYLSELNIKKTNYFLIIPVFAIFMYFSFGFSLKISANLYLYYHHGLTFYLWTIGFLLFYTLFINKVDEKLSNTTVVKFFKFAGKNVTIMYIIQWLIIGNIATEIYKTIDSISHLVIAFFIILSICSLLTYGYTQIIKKN